MEGRLFQPIRFLVPFHQGAFDVGCAVQNLSAHLRVWQYAIVTVVLERIENKVNGLSMFQSVNGNSEADNNTNETAMQEFKHDLNGIKTSFNLLTENIVELNRANDKIRQMRKDVEAYEEAVRRRAALAEQARLKEQATKGARIQSEVYQK